MVKPVSQLVWKSLPTTTGLEKPASAGLEKPAGMADQRENLTNKRGKPLGSGTTNATRKANRAHLQWANLAALGDPDTVESLEAHVQALEKARAKAEQKKALLEKTRSAPASGCASSSVKPPAALEKAAPAALEKAQGSGDGDSYSYYSSSPSTSTENERPKAKAKPHPRAQSPFYPSKSWEQPRKTKKKKMKLWETSTTNWKGLGKMVKSAMLWKRQKVHLALC